MIETPRLLLRRPTNNDMLIIENLWRDEGVRQFLGGVISDDLIKKKVVELKSHWDLHQFGQCMVLDKISKEIIGLCGLHQTEDGIELSYMFFSEFWKKGFAREAAAACIDYGFDILKLTKIIAITQEANIKSCQLLERIGMEHIRNFERFNANQCLFKIDNKQRCVSIERFKADDIPIIVDAFQQANWSKPASIFEHYLQEQRVGTRLMWVANVNNQFAGYVTLKWQSQYESFASDHIPEVMDLNVLAPFRKAGVGSMLLDIAEKEAATKSDLIGIGVGLYTGHDGGYGSAQRLYVKRGYVPDGKGVTYNYQPTIPGNSYPLDDDLVLWFTKKLSREIL